MFSRPRSQQLSSRRCARPRLLTAATDLLFELSHTEAVAKFRPVSTAVEPDYVVLGERARPLRVRAGERRLTV